jgi:hypothetical protein
MAPARTISGVAILSSLGLRHSSATRDLAAQPMTTASGTSAGEANSVAIGMGRVWHATARQSAAARLSGEADRCAASFRS